MCPSSSPVCQSANTPLNSTRPQRLAALARLCTQTRVQKSDVNTDASALHTRASACRTNTNTDAAVLTKRVICHSHAVVTDASSRARIFWALSSKSVCRSSEGSESARSRRRSLSSFPGTPGVTVSAKSANSRPLARSVQDLGRWRSSETGRGPLEEGWRDNHVPIMCSYKRVQCSFEVYGFQTRTEEFIHKVREPVSVSLI